MKNLNYYKKLDEKLKEEGRNFINLTSDFAFKSFFGNHKSFLKSFLIATLHLDIKDDESEIILNNVELPKDMEKEYQKKVDVLIFITPNTTLNLEVNKKRYKDIKRRNFIYLTKIYSHILKKGEEYQVLSDRPFYQLNINANKEDNKFGEEIYEYKGKYTGDVLSEQFITFIRNIEFYRNLYYNEHVKLDDDGMWLVLISSTSFEEMYKIAKKILNRKDMMIFMDGVEGINLDQYMLTKEEMEVLDKIEEYDTIKNAHDEGKAEGKDEGKAEIIKKFSKNMSIKEISKITNISEDEIKKLLDGCNEIK